MQRERGELVSMDVLQLRQAARESPLRSELGGG